MIDFFAGPFVHLMGRLATIQAALKQQGGNAKSDEETISLIRLTGEVSLVCERYELNVVGCINRALRLGNVGSGSTSGGGQFVGRHANKSPAEKKV